MVCRRPGHLLSPCRRFGKAGDPPAAHRSDLVLQVSQRHRYVGAHCASLPSRSLASRLGVAVEARQQGYPVQDLLRLRVAHCPLPGRSRVSPRTPAALPRAWCLVGLRPQWRVLEGLASRPVLPCGITAVSSPLAPWCICYPRRLLCPTLSMKTGTAKDVARTLTDAWGENCPHLSVPGDAARRRDVSQRLRATNVPGVTPPDAKPHLGFRAGGVGRTTA